MDSLYPDGARCFSCGKHIEVDATFVLLFLAALVVLMILDFRFYQIGIIGIICAVLLVVIGIGLRYIYPKFMPLKHYAE